MSDDVSGSDSDDLIWDFGKPNIREDIEEKFIKMKESKRKKKKAILWPSPHSMKVALDNARLNKPESPPPVQDEPLEAFRSHIKQFRDRLDKIAAEHTSLVTEDMNPTKKLSSSDKNSPPHKKVKAGSDASFLNDSIDEDSLTLCSQLVEDAFINGHVRCPDHLLDNQHGTTSSSNKVVICTVIEKSPDNTLRVSQPVVSQSSKAFNLLDDDDDLFLNESLSSY